MAITVTFGQRSFVVPDAGAAEASAGADASWPMCVLGRGSPKFPVHIVLDENRERARWVSRQAVAVRCVDDHWWQVRRLGVNGVLVACQNGARLDLGDDWIDVPARYGAATVTVTALGTSYRFTVTHGAGGAPLARPHGHVDGPTRHYSPKGYWRVAVVLCARALWDVDEPPPSHAAVRCALLRCGAESAALTDRAVDERVAYLYRITMVSPGHTEQLVRRLVRARVVTAEDVRSLLGADPVRALADAELDVR